MTKRFSFANLLGGRRAMDKDEPEGEYEDKEEGAETEEEETSAEGDEMPGEETPAEGEGEETDEEAKAAKGGKPATVAAAVAAERQRIGAILSSSSVGPHNLAMAAELACNTGLSAAEAERILKAAPRGGGLHEAMAGRDKRPGAGGAGGQKGPRLADLMASKFTKR